MKTQIFQHLGFFREYIINTKLIGTDTIKKPDREGIGYYSTQKHIADSDIILDNKKKIKKGQEYYTRIYPLCGKRIC